MCKNLSSELELPDGLVELGNEAFLGCSNITGDLKIPDNLKEIHYSPNQEDSPIPLVIPLMLNLILDKMKRSHYLFDGKHLPIVKI